MTVEAAGIWAEHHRRGRRTLSEFQRGALELVLQHRIMTRPQIRALVAPHRSEQTVRNELAQLEAAGYLGRAGRRSGRVTVVYITPAGADIAAAAVSARAFQMTPNRAANAIQEHTLAVNDVGVAFVRHARARGHECGPWDWEHEIAQRVSDSGGRKFSNLVTSDARLHCLLHLVDDDVAMTRLVELDRATKTPAEVYYQLRRYAQVLTYAAADERSKLRPRPFWQRQYRQFPSVLVIFTGGAEPLLERRMTAVLDLCYADPGLMQHVDALGLHCTTMRQLDERGPFDGIWHVPGGTRPVTLLNEPAPVTPLEARS